MNQPLLVFRHHESEGPGFLGEFLAERGINWELVAVDQGDPVPARLHGVGGLVFMGGPMSVNDPLPWIEEELKLIRSAHELGLPVLGHCLGGQLVSRALGGEVRTSPHPEIGWFDVERVDRPAEGDPFAELPRTFTAFHWHGEIFSLPDGAAPLIKSRLCACQGFTLGRILALQCHIEMTAGMVRDWIGVNANQLARVLPGIQTGEEILSDLDRRIACLQAVARTVYTCWLNGE